MSLFIIGSASRVTSNIVVQLAKNGQYSSVTIADVLPSYEHHHRYYRLQKQIDQLQLKLSLNLTKITQLSDIRAHQNFDDVLFVTHDYYDHVVSKTRLMELTANIYKNRANLYFATPVEYDHFGFENPERNYLNAQNKVKEIAPQSTIIRSDIQDKTEAMAYINSSKNFLDQQCFSFYAGKNFNPKVVSAQYYAQVVSNALKDKVQGKYLLVQGQKNKPVTEVEYNKDIDPLEYKHAKTNIAKMTSKYNGVFGENCEKVIEASQ